MSVLERVDCIPETLNRYVTLHFRDRRLGTASLRYRNRLEITVLYVWIEAISGMVSAPAQKLSGTVWLNIDLTSPISIQFLERFLTERCNFHNFTGFYLGFIFWGRSPEWPKATSLLGGSGGKPPQKFFKMNMHWDAFWCILRHIFEKCYSVCNDLVVARWFFQYSYLYTVVMIFFFGGGGGEAGHFRGEASTPQIP